MAIDPQDQAELNKLYQEYIRLLQITDKLTNAEAKAKADAAKAAGDLTKEINRLNKELDESETSICHILFFIAGVIIGINHRFFWGF